MRILLCLAAAAWIGIGADSEASVLQAMVTGDDGTISVLVSADKVVCAKNFGPGSDEHKKKFLAIIKINNDNFTKALNAVPKGSTNRVLHFSYPSPNGRYMAIATQVFGELQPHQLRVLDLKTMNEVSSERFADDIMDISWAEDSSSIFALKRQFKGHSKTLWAYIWSLAGHPQEINFFSLDNLSINELKSTSHLSIGEGAFSVGVLKGQPATNSGSNDCR